MKRFGLVMHDDLYNEFYRLFPDHGMRTTILRRCVYRMVQRAKVAGEVTMREVGDIAEEIQKEMEGA